MILQSPKVYAPGPLFSAANEVFDRLLTSTRSFLNVTFLQYNTIITTC